MFLNADKSNTVLHEFLSTENIILSKDEKKNNVLGMLILLLGYDNITDEKSICKMIELVKLIKYDSDFDELIDLTTNNIDNPNLNTKIINKYYCGDVLVNKESYNEFLLCINPPCDLFRPEKSNYCLKFLQGKKGSPTKLTSDLKSSEHGSIIPVNERPTVVVWSYNNERILCIKNRNDLNELKRYSRPFRMKEDYIKQIISKYSSFCMRMGVDELFLKDKNNTLNKGFLSIMKESD